MKICIYGASSDHIDSFYKEEAYLFGKLLAEQGHSLIFGGGQKGLMGACARGAHENGGYVIGISPRFFNEPGILYPGCNEMLFTETMSERKKLMEDLADAFVTLPGGIGTYEEFFETMTLKQLGRHQKPMILLNSSDYYSPFLALLRHTAETRFMSEKSFRVFDTADTPQQALQLCLQNEQIGGNIYKLE